MREDLPECGGELLLHPGLLVFLFVHQSFLTLGGGSSDLANLLGNQFVFPHVLLVLFTEQLPLELGPC